MTDAPKVETVAGLEPICESNPYRRYAPGEYEAECVAAHTYRNPLLRAWKCQLEFRLIGDGAEVFAFLNLGKGEKPKAGRHSMYAGAWTIANGGPPRRRQTMSARVFKGKIFQVKVGDVIGNYRGGAHHPSERYSVVREIVTQISFDIGSRQVTKYTSNGGMGKVTERMTLTALECKNFGPGRGRGLDNRTQPNGGAGNELSAPQRHQVIAPSSVPPLAKVG